MKARWALVAVIGVIAALLATLFANAATETRNDGNDVRGRLDVFRVKRWGAPENPGWSIFTRGRISTKEMWDRGFFVVELDTYGDGRFDYYALVKSNGRGINGSLWRNRKSNRDRRISKLSAWRSGRRVSVRIPLSKVSTGGKERVTYRWFVKTLFIGNHCRRVCIDRVPNKSSVTESNGKPTPSPTTEGSNSNGSPTPTPDVTEFPTATPVPSETESPTPTESP
jgi:hypothetical protein